MKVNESLHKLCSTQINIKNLFGDLGGLLTQAIRGIPDKFVYTDPNDPSLGKEKNPHITILYVLKNGDDYEKMLKDNSIIKRPKLHMTIGKISVFRFKGEKPYDVLKAEVSSISLTTLHYYLQANYENENTFPIYKPHVTLSYIKPGTCKELEGTWPLDGKRIWTDSFVFTDR